jgi:catechol 2,3-dioxygenase-like lactoylglutathione lyase family enzyme
MDADLGTHSLSLAVKNIEASFRFYEKLGFKPVEGAGSFKEKWMIIEKGTHRIGLFQGMFEENIITFNPKDARALYSKLKDEPDVTVAMASDTLTETDSGPCHFCIIDPDGNQILFDQF